MLSLKDGLCLLAVLVAYGIAGRIDDVETPREAKQAASAVDCTFDEAREPQGPMAPASVLAAMASTELQSEAHCLRSAP